MSNTEPMVADVYTNGIDSRALHAALALTDGGVLYFDQHWRCIFANVEAERLLGIPARQLAGIEASSLPWQPLLADGTVAPSPAYPVEQTAKTEGGQVACDALLRSPASVTRRMRLRAVADTSGDGSVSGVVLTVAALDVDQASFNAAARIAEVGQERFSALLEAAPDAIIMVDSDGRILMANRQTERMFGYRRSELVGSPLEILVPVELRDVHRVHREDYGAGPHPRAMGIGMDLVGLRKDGSRFPIEVSLNPIPSERGLQVITAVRDITDRKRIEIALRESNEMLHTVIASAPLAIIAVNMRGLVELWNPAAERMFERPAEEVVGRPLPPFPDGGEHTMRRLLAGGVTSVTQTTVSTVRDGVAHDFNIVLAPRQSVSGDISGMMAILEDITERRRAESALRDAKDEAEAANAAKSEFLSRMSHELRTPLNAILGFGQLLERTALSTAQQRNVHRIVSAGEHLLTLINEVLDIARIESGRLPLSSEPVRAADVVAEAVDLIRPLAAERGVRISTPREEVDTRAFVFADRQRLKQVLLNLLSNAVKYNPAGTVSVRCGPEENGYREISVQDTGIGIAPDKMPRLFSPFDRLGAESLNVEGTGLGLALSRRLVEAMGGSLTATSEPGVGSLFTITLAASTAPSLQPTEPLDSEGSGAPQHAHTVLYIEDNLPNLELIQELLLPWPDLDVLPAMQGQIGLELARQHHPDLVLLDLHLPDMAGADVLAQLKSDPRTRTIPVVIVSADVTAGQERRLIEAGAHAFVPKPLNIDRFLQLVSNVLEPPMGTR